MPFAPSTSSTNSAGVRVCLFAIVSKNHSFSFRKGLFLGTSVIICLSFLTVGIFLRLRNEGLIPKYLVAHFEFIPMVMIIVAYMGYGFGFGVIPGLLAAERTPVQIRYNVDPI